MAEMVFPAELRKAAAMLREVNILGSFPAEDSWRPCELEREADLLEEQACEQEERITELIETLREVVPPSWFPFHTIATYLVAKGYTRGND